MLRTVDSHLRTFRHLPILSSSSSSSSSTSTSTSSLLLPPFRAVFKHTSSKWRPHSLSLSKSLGFCSDVTSSSSSSFNYGVGDSGGANLGSFVVVRCISSLPSLGWNDPFSYSEVNEGNTYSINEDLNCGNSGSLEEDARPAISVRAYFFSTSVDLKSLVEHNKPNFIPPSSRMTNYIVLKFGNLSNFKNECFSLRHIGWLCLRGPDCLSVVNYVFKDYHVNMGACISGSDCCFVVVFQYGSIVLFNVREHEVDGYLQIVRKHASGLLPEMRKDEYEVREKPDLNTWMEGGLDYIMLQYLNIDGIRTIGSVLGQSIALDYYVRQVDGMVAEFTDINREMEMTGKFKMQRKKLFQLVGKANSNLADVILKLGLFERSDIAWKDAKFAQIWEYLRDEFELTQRFASLDFKLKFVEHNIRFLQEILQNRKSDFLEWVIIALIGAEILLSLYDIVHRSTGKL